MIKTIKHESSSVPSSAAPDEVAFFSALASEWWDEGGKFKLLHRINTPRLAYVRERAALHFGLDLGREKPFQGLKVMDIGCGGGLLCEPMRLLGASVAGIDASPENIRTASLHAQKSGLDIDYCCAAPERLAKETPAACDLLLAMEVIEHVAEMEGFLKSCAMLIRPGGALIAATISRTAKSFLLAKVIAEYALGWLPPGTHDWNKFVKPSELAKALGATGLEIKDLSGLAYDPLSGLWAKGESLDVNYMAFAVKG